jgi:acyl-CoA dehydrogenase
VNGQKVWISTAQVADRILLLARTTPLERVKRPTHGLSLFYTRPSTWPARPASMPASRRR